MREKHGKFFALLVLLLIPVSVFCAEGKGSRTHEVKKGETALQIALENNLTMEQLQQLNPGVDLEMMMVGDALILPDEGYDSFEDFLSDYYGEALSVRSLDCKAAADGAAKCLYRLENQGESALSNIRLRLGADDQNGVRRETEGSISLMQMLPGEILPGYLEIPGTFASSPECFLQVIRLTSDEGGHGAFRLGDADYRFDTQMMPGGQCLQIRLRFSAAAKRIHAEDSLNVLAAAYSEDGELTGVRTFYGKFITPLELTVCSLNGQTARAEVIVEAYHF